MKGTRMIAAALALAVAGVVIQARVANAAEVTVLCSVGMKAVMEALAPEFERATKNKVVAKYDISATLKREIDAGGAFDVVVLTPAMVDDLIKQGKVVADTRAAIARSGLALAIKAGTRKPDVSSADAFKKTLLDAKSIAYAKEGASGIYFADLIQRLKIADQLKAKSTLTTTGDAIGEAVAHGTAEIGILPVSEILPVRGVELGGTFPAEVQSYIVMVGGVSAHAKQAEAARDLMKFIMAPAANLVVKQKGMERVQ